MADTLMQILNIAHRGARAYAPENTLVAFAKSKIFDCQMFEMDVRMSKDGEIIVHHDENLSRCTDVKNKFPNRINDNISSFTYQELQTLDAGSWYVEQLAMPKEQRQWFLQSLTNAEIEKYVSPADKQHYTSGEITIPTLTQTLQLAKDLGLMVNVELKSPVENETIFINGVLNTVKQLAMEQKILVSSFDHGLLRQFRKQTKKIATAALTDLPLKAPVTYLRKLQAVSYNLGFDHDYQANATLCLKNNTYLKHIRHMRKSAFGVNIWTCNHPKEIRYLLSAGVTGIISDYPNRVQQETSEFLTKNLANIYLSTA